MNEPDPDAEFQAAQREFDRMANALEKYTSARSPGQTSRRPYCSFCGRAKAEVKVLVEGINASICETCVNDAQRLIQSPE
jgi:ClpX C4-type zinc finger